MVHEHPGVYSSYDASSVISGKKTARILGAAAVSTTGTANEVVTLTSYAEGVSAFGEDAEGTVGMAALLAALYRNGAAVVKAVRYPRRRRPAMRRPLPRWSRRRSM